MYLYKSTCTSYQETPSLPPFPIHYLTPNNSNLAASYTFRPGKKTFVPLASHQTCDWIDFDVISTWLILVFFFKHSVVPAVLCHY